MLSPNETSPPPLKCSLEEILSLSFHLRTYTRTPMPGNMLPGETDRGQLPHNSFCLSGQFPAANGYGAHITMPCDGDSIVTLCHSHCVHDRKDTNSYSTLVLYHIIPSGLGILQLALFKRSLSWCSICHTYMQHHVSSDGKHFT